MLLCEQHEPHGARDLTTVCKCDNAQQQQVLCRCQLSWTTAQPRTSATVCSLKLPMTRRSRHWMSENQATAACLCPWNKCSHGRVPQCLTAITPCFCTVPMYATCACSHDHVQALYLSPALPALPALPQPPVITAHPHNKPLASLLIACTHSHCCHTMVALLIEAAPNPTASH